MSDSMPDFQRLKRRGRPAGGKQGKKDRSCRSGPFKEFRETDLRKPPQKPLSRRARAGPPSAVMILMPGSDGDR